MTQNETGNPARRLLLYAAVAVGVIAVLALAFLWITGGSGEATEALNAPTLEPEETGVTFAIVSSDSEVRFVIEEELGGSPNTVIGVTNEVGGEIRVNFDNPAASEVGVIRINVRTLTTDDEFRNRAIRGQILQSAQEQFQFAQFAPTSLTGLPESITMGEAFSFQIVGDLTVRDITNSVTFDVTVTPVSETRIEGSATTIVTREAYGLMIPTVPGVANVADDVELSIDFVAIPADDVPADDAASTDEAAADDESGEADTDEQTNDAGEEPAPAVTEETGS